MGGVYCDLNNHSTDANAPLKCLWRLEMAGRNNSSWGKALDPRTITTADGTIKQSHYGGAAAELVPDDQDYSRRRLITRLALETLRWEL